MTAAKNETPEQRERRLARKMEALRKHHANETPEQREKRLAEKREYDYRRRKNETPEQREKRLFRNSLRNQNVHKPDEYIDPSVGIMVFCQCLADGLDPNFHYNITASAFKIGNEFEWLGRGHLHPDTVSVYASSLSYRWRNEPKLRRRFYQD